MDVFKLPEGVTTDWTLARPDALPRIDVLYVIDGERWISKGTPAIDPSPPYIPPGAQAMAQVTVRPSN